MKAMVLCAGHGTRLQPITTRFPKPLVPVLGQSILHHIFDYLKQNGIQDVAINSSIMAEKFSKSIAPKQTNDFNIFHSYEGQNYSGNKTAMPLGSAGGMREVQNKFKFFEDSFVVLCGDAIVDLDLQKMMAFHKSHGGLATIATLEVMKNDVENYGMVVPNIEGRILSFQEKPAVDEALSQQANTGIYIFEPEIFDHIPKNGAFDIGSQLFPKLIEQGEAIYAYKESFNWIDFGKLSDYTTGSFSLLCGQMNNFHLKAEEIKPNIYVGKNVKLDASLSQLKGPIYIGDNTIIKQGAKILGPAIISNNCLIEDDTFISDSIISSGKHIRKGAHLTNRLFFEDWIIQNDTWMACDAQSGFEHFITPLSNDVDCVVMKGGVRDQFMM